MSSWYEYFFGSSEITDEKRKELLDMKRTNLIEKVKKEMEEQTRKIEEFKKQSEIENVILIHRIKSNYDKLLLIPHETEITFNTSHAYTIPNIQSGVDLNDYFKTVKELEYIFNVAQVSARDNKVTIKMKMTF